MSALAAKSAELYANLANVQGVASSSNHLGFAELIKLNHAQAYSLYEQSLKLAHESEHDLLASRALVNMGEVARTIDDYRTAKALYEQSLLLSRGLLYKMGMAAALHNLGYVALHTNEYKQGIQHFTEALALFYEMGDQQGIAESLIGQASCLEHTDGLYNAGRLLGAAATLLSTLGSVLQPTDSAEYDRVLLSLRKSLGLTRFRAEWAKGQAAPISETLEFALTTTQ